MWGTQLGTIATTTASIKIKCSNAGTLPYTSTFTTYMITT